jgi:hypothetical protein
MASTISKLPEFMTATQVAKWRGVSRQTIGNWMRSGRINADHQANNSGVAMYRVSHLQEVLDGISAPGADPTEVPNLNDERAMHEQAKRKKAELDLAARAAELLDAKEVQDTWVSVATITRQRVLGCIPSISAQLAATDSQHEVTQLLERALRDALTMTTADIMETE